MGLKTAMAMVSGQPAKQILSILIPMATASSMALKIQIETVTLMKAKRQEMPTVMEVENDGDSPKRTQSRLSGRRPTHFCRQRR